MSVTEDKMVEWFASRNILKTSDYPIGIGDDMAQVCVDDDVSVLITTDMLLQGVHFDLETATLDQVGYKAMAASLSDCAAMATLPVAAVVCVGLPKGFTDKELKQLHRGINKASIRFDCPLVGGDITSWPDRAMLVISVAMMSRPIGTGPIRRSGAKVSDCICVTGLLGGAIHGKHLTFEPRVKEAIKIASMVKVNSMIDISDGLSSDLNRICHRSGVGALVEAQRIPISPDAKRKADPLASALNDGEDFELLFTLSEKNYKLLMENWSGSVPITCIGRITDTGKVQIKTSDGRLNNLEPRGYEHLG